MTPATQGGHAAITAALNDVIARIENCRRIDQEVLAGSPWELPNRDAYDTSVAVIRGYVADLNGTVTGDVNDTEPERPRDIILDEIVNLVAAGCDCSTRPNSQEACETCTREAETVTDTILARLRLNQRHGNGWSCIDDGNPCARADAGNCEHRYATTWWETPTMTTGANL